MVKLLLPLLPAAAVHNTIIINFYLNLNNSDLAFHYLIWKRWLAGCWCVLGYSLAWWNGWWRWVDWLLFLRNCGTAWDSLWVMTHTSCVYLFRVIISQHDSVISPLISKRFNCHWTEVFGAAFVSCVPPGSFKLNLNLCFFTAEWINPGLMVNALKSSVLARNQGIAAQAVRTDCKSFEPVMVLRNVNAFFLNITASQRMHAKLEETHSNGV